MKNVSYHKLYDINEIRSWYNTLWGDDLWKRNRRNIEEVGSGFGILRENLEDWIEIAKKNKKN